MSSRRLLPVFAIHLSVSSLPSLAQMPLAVLGVAGLGHVLLDLGRVGLHVGPRLRSLLHHVPTSGSHAAQFSISTVGSNGLTMSFKNCSRSNAYENAARRFVSSNGLPGFSLNQMFSYCVVVTERRLQRRAAR